MPRMKQADAFTAITAAVQAAGGTITDADLRTALTNSGNADAIEHLGKVKRFKVLNVEVLAPNLETVPYVQYTLPS